MRCLLFLVGAAVAHMCVMEPRQRGTMDISSWANPSCFRRVPCDGDAPAGPVTTVPAGPGFAVRLQQNANHFSLLAVGFIDVAISAQPSRDPDAWTTLATVQDYPAHDQVTQTNFTIVVSIPDDIGDTAVMRFRYVSLNQDEIDPANNTQAIFWQCADIKISSSSALETKKKTTTSKKRAHGSHRLKTQGCCAPSTFQMTGIEHDDSGATKNHAVYWDASRSLTRWDKYGIQLYNNYSNLHEYIYDPTTKKCELAGADGFYGWCFGTRVGFQSPYMYPKGAPVDGVQTWAAANGFEFGSTVESCYPAFRRLGTQNITWSNQKPLESSSVFDLPAECAKLDHFTVGCRAHKK